MTESVRYNDIKSGYFIFRGKVTKSREQNKETCFFFCRDGVSSPSFDGRVTKKQVETKINYYLCSQKVCHDMKKQLLMKQPQLDYYDLGAGVIAFSSTRHGGCSTGNYAAFNINRYCGDQEENIRKNRQALCQKLGITDNSLIMPHQVHETQVAKIDDVFFSLTADERQEALEGVDAVMTNLNPRQTASLCCCMMQSTMPSVPFMPVGEARWSVLPSKR